MKKPSLLDSHAVLVYLKGEKGYEKVKSALAAAEKSGIPLLISEINVGEVCYTLLRAGLVGNLDDFLSLLFSLPIEPVPVDFDLILDAARIKAGHALSYADAFAVATARRKGAAIITGDPEFKAVTSLVSVEWI